MPRSRTWFVLLPHLLGLLACPLQSQPGAEGQPSTAPSPTPESAATPVALDLCSLLTAVEISEASGEPVEEQPGLLTASCIWVATTDGVQGFDPTTNTLAVKSHTAADPWSLAAAGGSPWVTTNAEGGILQLDPLTGELIRTVARGVTPIAIAAGP